MAERFRPTAEVRLRMYKHLLIATDGSELGHEAVGQGLSLARALGAKATVVTVTAPWFGFGPDGITQSLSLEDYERMTESHAASILSSAIEMARKSGISCDTLHVKNQSPSDGIVETARRLGCDLIVVASHGRRGISRLVLGSQANRILVQSPVPVLIYR